jgi:hypothetical protein
MDQFTANIDINHDNKHLLGPCTRVEPTPFNISARANNIEVAENVRLSTSASALTTLKPPRCRKRASPEHAAATSNCEKNI